MPRMRSSLRFPGGPQPQTPEGFRSQLEHSGEKLSRSLRTGEFQPDGTAVWLDRQLECEETAALPLGVDDFGNRRQQGVSRLESNAVALKQVDSFSRATHESPEQVFASCPECGCPQSACDWQVRHKGGSRFYLNHFSNVRRAKSGVLKHPRLSRRD